jgi:hypothetical protein
MANCLPYAANDYNLAVALIIPDKPDKATRRTFVQAVSDGLNQGRASIPVQPGSSFDVCQQ